MRLACVLGLALACGPARADDCAEERERIDSWAWGWGLANGAAATAISLGAVPLLNSEDRVDLYVGAGSSAVGVISVVIPAVQARDCAALPRIERQGKSWLMHTANVLFNGGLGLLLGLGYDHWAQGALQAGLGTLVGELMMYSQPSGAIVSPTAAGLGLQISGRF